MSGINDSVVYANLSGLSPNSKYYFTISDSSACGTETGSDSIFFTLAKLAELTTGKADSITATSVKVYGTVNPYNSTASVEFEYGTTTGYGNKVSAVPPYAYSDSVTAVSAKITGLIPNQKYYYRINATNQAGTSKGADSSFITNALKPTAKTEGATNITAYQAILNAKVNAQNSSTITYFEWGTTTSYGKIDTASQSPITGYNDQQVSVNLSNLSPNTTYYFRVVAVNQAGTTYGNDTMFTTSGLQPVVNTYGATNVLAYSAELRGMLNPNNSSTTAYFEYGTTLAYGGIINLPQSPFTGKNDIFVSETLPVLQPNTTYHYRLTASNAFGTVYGNDVQFTTLALKPAAITQSATNISDSGATLNANITAYNSGTKVTFEYGPTTAYGQVVNAIPDSVFGMNATQVNYNLTGLKPNTTIHYRVVAENQAGVTYGNDSSFTTIAILPEAMTGTADSVETKSAKLTANIKANNSATSVYFEYGKTTAYGNSVVAFPDTVHGMNWENVYAYLTGLEMNTVYHYRVVAENQAGKVYGNDMSFTTDFKDVPYAKTLAATFVEINSAQLNGKVNPNNLPTKVSFEWGTSIAYGNTINAVPDSLSGLTTTNVIFNLTGLQPNTTYHYRVKAVNDLGTVYGNDTFFTTQVDYPYVTTAAISNITDNSATCGGNVVSDGGASVTERGVVWSTSPNPDISLSTKTVDGSGTGNFVSQITGLSSKTTYYVRAYATNSKGTTYGNEVSFTTTNVSLKEDNLLNLKFIINQNQISISGSSDDIISLQLYDLQGKLLKSHNFINQCTIDISEYSSSVYLIKASSKNKYIIKKIVVE